MSTGSPVATIRGYRKTGAAVVTVQREGCAPHRYEVSLKRYHALGEWILFGGHPWRTSGGWMRSSMQAALWAKEVPHR